ncbi:hypothetical protein GJR95_02745 [Spirosoma endbachense]|uniref:Uncharacterized protein n=1 Tax=Spirosoma endbachense TaxID=2666025 RepID=A0A6P1VNL0_9BACT|nr:hypothetical protein GJR95_02745 [Spirosoma endbachense]
MKTATLKSTKPTSKNSGVSSTGKRQGILPGKGPWVSLDGKWYTKNTAGEWIPMKAS